MKIDEIYKQINNLGGRLTKVRKVILDSLINSDCLMSQDCILKALKKNDLKPNRSTIFRELTYLVKTNTIIKNTINSIDYYEIPKAHHHHLVCLKCHEISKIEIKDHFEIEEKKISKEKKFNILNHSLEFYGYCENCNTF